jgi:hypothetical protein
MTVLGRGEDLRMKSLVGLAGVLLTAAAGAGQPGPVAMQSCPSTPSEGVMAKHNGAAGLICETRARHRPEPKLEVTITPPKVTIPDNSKQGTLLARITVRWSNGEPFRGEVRLTKNTAGICQLSGMELRLSRDITKAEDATKSVCTVTALK